ncbi:helix-turn-helix domain-containing protein [Streptomyces capuensis]|uniref:helix-turn-helix domain-containing protein n=1 Tax=Streptomyces capuensis TaxID=1464056 RepID=UPI0004BFFB0D|nr:helix-turn-helix domain-containing protein [Streptomyces capuensis]
MTDINITTTNGKLEVSSPYHPDMPPLARGLGGRWNPANRTWAFDQRDEDRIRDMLRGIFGTDGSPVDQADLITVRWDISNYCHSKGDNELRLAGRLVASRRSRDTDVRLGENVVLISGGFPGSAGSMQYPALAPRDNTVIEVRDIPRAAVDLDDEGITLVESTIDTDALRAERTKLLDRLAEIDAALATAGEPAEEAPAEAPAPARAVPTEADTTGVITIRIDTTLDIEGATTAAFAAAAGISTRTARRWAASGRIPAQRSGHRWIITA